METCSPNVFSSPKSSASQGGSSSSRTKLRLSEIRYTPTQNNEENLKGFMLDICQDSLEIPRPISRLIEFTQVIDGEGKPRQVLMPLFYNKNSPGHQRQTSLKPVANPKQARISEMLLEIRDKPKPKSSLKCSTSKKQKTVSFCSHIELSSPEALQNSMIFIGDQDEISDSLEKASEKMPFTTANSLTTENSYVKVEKFPDTTASTQQNIELHEDSGEKPQFTFEVSQKFKFEENVRSSLGNLEVEFNEFSTVAYCNNCEKEIVTAVSFEKSKGQHCGDTIEWILCWVFPTCMFKNKRLLHKCPTCDYEIANIEWQM